MARKKEMCSLKCNEPGAGIVLMKLDELHSFEGHPFKVERNQELFELRDSIEKEGVLVPLLVRKNPYGDGYEIIAGHRRKEAAHWAGLMEVPTIIRELDDDQSVMFPLMRYKSPLSSGGMRSRFSSSRISFADIQPFCLAVA